MSNERWALNVRRFSLPFIYLIAVRPLRIPILIRPHIYFPTTACEWESVAVCAHTIRPNHSYTQQCVSVRLHCHNDIDTNEAKKKKLLACAYEASTRTHSNQCWRSLLLLLCEQQIKHAYRRLWCGKSGCQTTTIDSSQIYQCIAMEIESDHNCLANLNDEWGKGNGHCFESLL